MRPWEKDPLLRVEHLTMRFGGLVAVDDVSFDVGRQDITALIGPNGAGKTTVFNCITGFYKPSEGMMKLAHPDGQSFNLERMDDHDINSRACVARTFQNIRLFPGMTVLENLMVAQHNVLTRASGLPTGAVLGFGIFATIGALLHIGGFEFAQCQVPILKVVRLHSARIMLARTVGIRTRRRAQCETTNEKYDPNDSASPHGARIIAQPTRA